ALDDDGGQEAVEGLLGAAVGVVHQVRQGVYQSPRQRRRVTHFQPRLGDPPVLRHVQRDGWPGLVGAGQSGAGVPRERAWGEDGIGSMPGTKQGKDSCMASASSSETALTRTTAWPSPVTFTRQSTRLSPLVGTLRVCLAEPRRARVPPSTSRETPTDFSLLR